MTQLSKHFALTEFTASATAADKAIDNTPLPNHVEALETLAYVMEAVRLLLGRKPIFITSGYRCSELNEAVGGSTSSAHCAGDACDFICPDYGTPYEIVLLLMKFTKPLGIDQLIYECGCDGEGDEWVHLGLRENPRGEVLTIDSHGTHPGLVKTV